VVAGTVVVGGAVDGSAAHATITIAATPASQPRPARLTGLAPEFV
jgi:hypothetical protein